MEALGIFLKKIQFACSQINLLYLGYDTPNNRPISRAAKKGNLESLQGQTVNHRFAVPVRFADLQFHIIVKDS